MNDLIQSVHLSGALSPSEILTMQSSVFIRNLIDTTVEALMLQKKIEEEDEAYKEEINYSKKILQQANIINIKLDGKLFTYLPYIEGVSSSHTLKNLLNRLPMISK